MRMMEFIPRTKIQLVLFFLSSLILAPSYSRSTINNHILTKDWRFYDPVDGACVYIPGELTREQRPGSPR